MSFTLLSRDKESALKNIELFFMIALTFAPLAALLRSIAFFTSFDAEIGYFNDGFFSDTVSSMLVVCSIFFLAGFIFISKEAKLSAKIDNSANSIFFSACFAGFVMLADFAYKIYTLIGEDKFTYYKFIFNPAFKAENAYMIRATAIIEIAGVLASVLTAACFFVRSSKVPKAKLSAILGFFPIIRALVGVAEIYFDMKVQMNHPSKLMLQFALIAVMFYFLCEERFYVSDEHARPRRFFISGCLAFFLAFAGGVSEIVGFFSGKLSKGDLCVEAFFCLVMSFYILARTNAFVRCVKVESDSEIEADEAVEEEKSEE